MNLYERPTRANQALYDLTRDLCSGGLLVDCGTPYPCTQADLDSYRHFFTGNYYFRPMSTGTAVDLLIDFLDPYREPSPEVRGALRRLEAGINMKYKAPDIVIRAFRDLDTVFFGGNLSGKVLVFVSMFLGVGVFDDESVMSFQTCFTNMSLVYIFHGSWLCPARVMLTLEFLQWKGERGVSAHLGTSAVMNVLGYARTETPGRASISLNSELLLKHRRPEMPEDPFELIWEVMLHEMTVGPLRVNGHQEPLFAFFPLLM